ncbi:tetratricopeptide repeat protein [Bdellovibrio svalbardensis]|uniref:Tetratricopeptide repeat protein n=1 Tax=Bdellovibrio svalbardensis TaxID=2972972 RepID=A0ABT6DHX2_9BACT|nr:hypothetical protein [Bdellovibrio svalbardensis]MDG0816458.1 hypothetical protein [Bdellovibrio svalbardensis]
MFILMIANIFFVILGIFSASHAEPNFNREPLMLNIGDSFCRGDFEQFDRYIKDVPPDNPFYLQYQLAGLNTPNGLALVTRRMQESPKDLSQISNLDRLLFGVAMTQFENPDKSRIRQFLDFKSNNRILEIYRQEILGLIDSDAGKSLAISIDAFAALPYLDSGILKSIYNLGIRYKDRERILGQFSQFVDKFPDNSSEKYVLMAYRELVPLNQKDKLAYYEYSKKAFELCKYDSEIAILHIGSLISQNKLGEAEMVLREQIKIRPNYSAYFDYYLGKILLEKGSKAEALSFLNEANRKRGMLASDYQSKLDDLISKANGFNWFYPAIALVLIVAGGVVISLRRRKIE